MLKFLGLVTNFGDRVASTEVNERSLRQLYTRIGDLRELLSDQHHTQIVKATVQHQPPQPLRPQVTRMPPPPPSVQQQQAQYPSTVPPMPTLAQVPILPQVSSVPVPPPQTQTTLPFNPNLVRPTPQFPPNAYAPTVFQQRPVNLAANYLFQQPLMSPQPPYFQLA